MVLQAVGRFHLHVLPAIPVLLMVLILGDRCVGAIKPGATGGTGATGLAIGPVSQLTLMTESLVSSEQKKKRNLKGRVQTMVLGHNKADKFFFQDKLNPSLVRWLFLIKLFFVAH